MSTDPIAGPSTISASTSSSNSAFPYTDATLDPETVLALNRQVAKPFWVEKTKREAGKAWNLFYKQNQANFFKDRQWTTREFEDIGELVTAEAQASPTAGPSKVVLEVGCGVGNFLYPIIEQTKDVRFHCCDLSSHAISLVQSHPSYSPSRVHAFVHDLCLDSPPLLDRLKEADPTFRREGEDGEEGVKVDVVSCVFVLSAVPPEKFAVAIRRMVETLKPGGCLIFRDYALHDSAQLRLHSKPSSSYSVVPPLLSSTQPLYKRADGTLTYFFTESELEGLFEAEGMQGKCEVVERMTANRKEGWQIKRRFVQGTWRKPAA